MVKRILIIAYYYPPNNNIPSWRPYSWAKYFSNKENGGAEVHVVCRYWDGSEKTWDQQVNPSHNERNFIEDQGENLKVHYLAPNRRVKKLLRIVNRLGPLRSVFHFGLNFAGHHHIEVDTFFTFRNYILQKFPKGYFDVLIVTSPPLNIIRLGYSLRTHFPKAFFVADFRDLWSNEILRESYRPSMKDRIYNGLNVSSLRKWLRKFDLATSVSKALVDKLAGLGTIKTAVVTNGYESEMFLGLKKTKTKSFNITSVGTIYKHQEFDILVNGIIKFVEKNEWHPTIQVQFIGAKPYNLKLCDVLEHALPASNLLITDRIDRNEALQIMKDASVLVYPGWNGYKGIMSGKIFEYLAAGNNVIIAPSDNDVIAELLEETGSGVSVDSSEAVTKKLQEWYDEWKKNGYLKYSGSTEAIKKYSRENQARRLSDLIGLYRTEKTQLH